MDSAELEQFIIEMGEPGFRAKQLFEWIHGKHAADFAEMTNLPKTLREKLESTAKLPRTEVVLDGFAEGRYAEIFICAGKRLCHRKRTDEV